VQVEVEIDMALMIRYGTTGMTSFKRNRQAFRGEYLRNRQQEGLKQWADRLVIISKVRRRAATACAGSLPVTICFCRVVIGRT